MKKVRNIYFSTQFGLVIELRDKTRITTNIFKDQTGIVRDLVWMPIHPIALAGEAKLPSYKFVCAMCQSERLQAELDKTSEYGGKFKALCLPCNAIRRFQPVEIK